MDLGAVFEELLDDLMIESGNYYNTRMPVDQRSCRTHLEQAAMYYRERSRQKLSASPRLKQFRFFAE